MGFLFRKYSGDGPDEDVVQDEPDAVASEEMPKLEFTLFPLSPKAQIVLIAAGFILFNIALIAIWAFLMFRYF